MSMSPQGLNYSQGPRSDLRKIATYQRAVILCILTNVILYVIFFAARGTPLVGGLIALCILGVGITAAVFIFMLALAVYNIAAGIILGILTLVPLIGLIVLLIVNSKATSILRAHGVTVGFLGANPNQVPPG